MFDYFRYIVDEMNGIDGEKAAEIRKQKAEQEKENTFIFTKRAKVIIAVLAIFFFIVSLFTLMYYGESKSKNVIEIILEIIRGCAAAEIAVCMFIKKDRAEILALIGIGIFVLVLLVGAVI